MSLAYMLELKNPAHRGNSSTVATLIVKTSVSFEGYIAVEVELITMREENLPWPNFCAEN